ncbi:MAG: ferredoxin, partial [Clostridia bacterium]|nr:ferredoxin [Clostridia bacterium]
MEVALRMLTEIEELYNDLPQIDCGSCGSPSCHAMAEDIVKGYAKKTDCIFKLKEKLKHLAE